MLKNKYLIETKKEIYEKYCASKYMICIQFNNDVLLLLKIIIHIYIQIYNNCIIKYHNKEL